ncbi:hypothetical protein [Actinoplanes awajinensis]|uniref:Uncharacterized protein n=1 Tax=Actinoplanes awajinensis subsp. mycoplanecinus TaxID=135947 RepID=A0A101JLX3_9ACTN|nr:hypothetical protein [Actinoplanes awajinensis]KUL29179.1 hypothetical protein ADL15_28890 [Actinoplanes awajinensis subsp. mycoplanecinus]
MCFPRPRDRGPIAYLTVSASAVLLGIGTGPMGLGSPGAPIVALFCWVLTAAAAEVVAGNPRRLNLLPWMIGAMVLVAFAGPGAVTALLGAAAAGYGLTTIVTAAPARRIPPRAHRVEPATTAGGRTFDITTDLNRLPASHPADTGPLPVLVPA